MAVSVPPTLQFDAVILAITRFKIAHTPGKVTLRHNQTGSYIDIDFTIEQVAPGTTEVTASNYTVVFGIGSGFAKNGVTLDMVKSFYGAAKEMVDRMKSPGVLSLQARAPHLCQSSMAVQISSTTQNTACERVTIPDSLDLLVDVVQIKKHIDVLFSRKDPKVWSRFHAQPTTKSPYDTMSNDRFFPNPKGLDLSTLQVCTSFTSFQQYYTTFLAAAMQDSEEELEKIKKLESTTQSLFLIPADTSDPPKQYYGNMKRPTREEYQLMAGDSANVIFSESSTLWKLSVVEGFQNARKDMLCVIVRRGMIGDTVRLDDFEPTIYGKILPTVGSQTPISRTNFVKVKLTDCEGSITRLQEAYRTLSLCSYRAQNSKDYKPSAWRSRIVRIIMACRLDKSTGHDIYEEIRNDADFELPDMTRLNDAQKAMVHGASEAEDKMLIGVGPPGTGKTYTGLALLEPFLTTRRDTLVLLSAPTNHGSDDLAAGVDRLLKRLAERCGNLPVKHPYVVRLHSYSTEMDLAGSEVKDDVKIDAHNPVVTPTATDFLLESYISATEESIKAVKDERVKLPKLSVGEMMKHIAGIYPNSIYKHEDTSRFSTWCKLHKRRSQGMKMSDAEKLYWSRTNAELYELALQGASVIVGTSTGLTSSTVLDLVKDRVSVICLDEAAFEREDHYAPWFAAEFEKNPGLILLGDPHQLRPYTHKRSKTPFSQQLRLSFMERMISVGRKHTMLTEQYRMASDIVHISNNLSYGGQLTTPSSVDARPKTVAFRKYCKEKFGKESNVLMVDLALKSNYRLETKREEGRRSKGNDYFVCITEGILLDLLANVPSDSSIVILTFYKFQLQKYQRLVSAMMRKNGLDKDFPALEILMIGTVNSGQGREFDYVLLDMPTDGSMGFLEDRNLLNVSMSRARHGLIFICDQKDCRAAFAHGSTAAMLEVMDLFADKIFRPPILRTGFPTTKYYVRS